MSRILPFVLVMVGCANASSSIPAIDAEVIIDVDAPVVVAIDAPVTPDAPPDGNGCATQPCDIATQCGCAATQSCDLDTSDLDGSVCRPITTAGRETTPCNSPDDCDHGYVCLGNAAGRSCRRYCDDNADCVAPRGQCVIDIVNGTTPIPGIPPVCSSGCDPTNVAAGGCPTNWKCGVYTQTHQSMTYNIADCNPSVGALVQGGNCEVANVGDDKLCAANFLCTTVNAGADFGCRRICNRTAGGGCGGLTCLAFNPAVTIAGVEYGVCD